MCRSLLLTLEDLKKWEKRTIELIPVEYINEITKAESKMAENEHNHI